LQKELTDSKNIVYEKIVELDEIKAKTESDNSKFLLEKSKWDKENTTLTDRILKLSKEVDELMLENKAKNTKIANLFDNSDVDKKKVETLNNLLMNVNREKDEAVNKLTNSQK